MNEQRSLPRELGLREAVALNMIDMVGIGPFIVMPLVIQYMGGPQSFLAWIAGALLSLVDGCIWSELGAAMPQAGGSSVFLREIYGRERWGRFMSFLFIWQTSIQAPLVVASGAIGFAQYASYIYPLSIIEKKIVSGVLVVVLVLLLYRKITTIGKISLLLWGGVIAAILLLIVGGATHFDAAKAFDFPEHAFALNWLFFAALGHASVKTMYSFLGYYNVCHLGAEIKDPEKNIPRSIFISIIAIAAIYLALQWSIMGVIPWREAQHSEFIVSLFVERLYGSTAAIAATVLILWIAFASLFAVLLGYSRIPFAAANDGLFFAPFGKLHPTKNFPHVSLLVLGGTAFIFSLLFRLPEVITAILAMRIIIQFIGQAVGAWQLRKRLIRLPFVMPLYPIPAVVAVFAWAGIFISTGFEFAIGGLIVIATGSILFFVRARARREWPFALLVAISLCFSPFLFAADQEKAPRILIVTAHPDDETACAGTVYVLTHEMHAVVDLAVITNGEAGYKYSMLAEPIYGEHLTEESIGRAKLPAIRKKELEAGGKIIGIRHYIYFDQKDTRYTLDADTVLTLVWDVKKIRSELKKLITSERYRYVLTLLPTRETHGHHKAAAILALETIRDIAHPKRPIILGMTVARNGDSVAYKFLPEYPITENLAGYLPFMFDRTQSFGYLKRLNYKIIANWMIAEHKSQGAMQLGMNEGDKEVFWFFALNDTTRYAETKSLFDSIGAKAKLP